MNRDPPQNIQEFPYTVEYHENDLDQKVYESFRTMTDALIFTRKLVDIDTVDYIIAYKEEYKKYARRIRDPVLYSNK